jgi:hypothetical protein
MQVNIYSFEDDYAAFLNLNIFRPYSREHQQAEIYQKIEKNINFSVLAFISIS